MARGFYITREPKDKRGIKDIRTIKDIRVIKDFKDFKDRIYLTGIELKIM